jgi:NAD(P)-dependent dehydrogenase (short-subunit alcohol dehydrogenase family)
MRIVVVGGSSGIGLAVAALMAEAGAEVTIASRSSDKLARARDTIGAPVQCCSVDITDNAAVDAFFQTVGPYDHLVVTAATAVLGSVRDLPIERAQAVFDSKFWGAYRVVRAGARAIATTGSITLCSGAASQRGTPGLAVGAAINAALESLGRTLAVELAPVRVNTIAPGLIDTPVWDDITSPEQRAAVFADASARLPLKRVGRPAEIAHAVRYLIENTYVTGSVLFVDGGYLQV